MSSLVIQTSFLGDVVLTTPLLASLARRDAVDVVTTRAGAGLLEGHPSVRDVIVYDKRGTDEGVAGFARTASRLRHREDGSARGANVAYMAQGSVRSAALALASRIPQRVGFNTSAGRRLYTERVEYRDDRHHAERLWSLANSSASEPPEESRTPRLVPHASHVAEVDELLHSLHVSPNEALLAMAPGSVWATKRWPHFPALASTVSSSVRVVLVGSPEERPLAAEVVAAALASGGRPPVDATGKLSLLASAELIGRCSALVSNDSLPQHLASAMGTPTVTVFGPTVPGFGFGPLAPGSRTVGVEHLPCRPCDRHGPRTCPLTHWKCMRTLDARVVADLVAPHLSPQSTL